VSGQRVYVGYVHTAVVTLDRLSGYFTSRRGDRNVIIGLLVSGATANIPFIIKTHIYLLIEINCTGI
jgi:hypothetical protein